MIFEDGQVYYEEGDKCVNCEHLAYCEIPDFIKDTKEDFGIDIEWTSEDCSHFKLLKDEITGDYLAEVLLKAMKEKES
ncbi:MAG: hypothetical protein US20_C0023G0012 [Candidatus Pacebacteria bacterium GW2011_GWF1_36_5]|nr:MAG: hypothetical protein US20_C0023G0012 [Candidatus Pacebacteria bacterium GW2011_GWF1_36_5]